MFSLRKLFTLAVVLYTPALGLNNGLGKTPAMGWNSYNAFSCGTTEAQYRANAQALVDLGLDELGYQYLNLDCGWQGSNRNSTGGFTTNSATIPSGIPALSDFVHGLGLKFGLYSDGGYFACGGNTGQFLGSLEHETEDAVSFANWGADYLKYDNCFAVSPTDTVDYNPPFDDHMAAMRDALAATGKPILFSVCEWGVQDPARWPGTNFGNSWRMSNDIADSWDHVFRIINQVVPITQFAGPGGFNDLDLLEVGNNGLTLAEQQTHFAFWAAVKSPLFISTDLTKISPEALSILQNRDVIALNQDGLGQSIRFRRRYTNAYDVWSGPLSDGSTVAVVFNLQDTTRDITFSYSDVGLTSAVVSNVITHSSSGGRTTSYQATLEGHGVLVLRMSDGTPSSPPEFTFYEAADPANTLNGGASTRVVNSTVTVVGFIGNGGTLTINGVDGGTEGGTKLVSFDYINGDFTYFNTDCSNCRNAFVSVNGGSAVQVQMPISGQSWDILFSGYLVSLSGFKPGTSNTIRISNPSAFAPDFFRVGVEN
ncbi:hypothetical protein VKT23_008066 [Stygiomarasmius scandens]|uniref:Alpha-galactosidase n=1 Tax=Marasmiellus scandens TaxID=2682957 RepID=A0ABR1JKE1_9AGAR